MNKGAPLTGVDLTRKLEYMCEQVYITELAKIPKDPRTGNMKRQDVTFLGNPQPNPMCVYLVHFRSDPTNPYTVAHTHRPQQHLPNKPTVLQWCLQNCGFYVHFHDKPV